MHCGEKGQLFIAPRSTLVIQDGVLFWKKTFSGDVAEKPFHSKCAAFTKPAVVR